MSDEGRQADIEHVVKLLQALPKGPYVVKESPVDYTISQETGLPVAIIPKWGKNSKATMELIEALPRIAPVLSYGITHSNGQKPDRRAARGLLQAVFDYHRKTQHPKLTANCYFCYQENAWKNPPPENMKYPVLRGDGTWYDRGHEFVPHEAMPWVRKMRLEPCHYCGIAPAGTIDHKVPTSKGGRWIKTNVVPACHPCNNLKGTLSYEDFMEILSRGLRKTLEQHGIGGINFKDFPKSEEKIPGVEEEMT